MIGSDKLTVIVHADQFRAEIPVLNLDQIAIKSLQE